MLTTNETYFFRENDHFEDLKREVLPKHPRSRPHRIWSAACSSGEEAYSIAMLLDDYLGKRSPWEVLGSDISRRMVELARIGKYPRYRIDAIPPAYLARYCLCGDSGGEDSLSMGEGLRALPVSNKSTWLAACRRLECSMPFFYATC